MYYSGLVYTVVIPPFFAYYQNQDGNNIQLVFVDKSAK